MIGPPLAARTLTWRASDDPPGSWVYELGGDVVAELGWSAPERLVRAETAMGVWHIELHGTFVLRGVLTRRSEEVPRLYYAGGLRRGLARTPDGRTSVLVTGWDTSVGPWTGFDDVDGTGIVRVRGRVGSAGIWSEVSVTPEAWYASVADPLLLLWGALQVVRRKRPWLGLLTAGVSDRSAERQIGTLSPAPG